MSESGQTETRLTVQPRSAFKSIAAPWTPVRWDCGLFLPLRAAGANRAISCSAMTEGEIAVTSKEELHAAPLNGKRLLALWNALPGVEKRRKVGDRSALIDQLWTAIEALPEPEPQSDTKRPSKQNEVIAMLRRPEGATVDEVASAMGWQRHTVRGLFSGTLKKKLGLTLASAQDARGRVYRIALPEQA